MSSDWSLIYRSDENGNVLSGSVNALRDAVLDAADVKIVYRTVQGRWWSRYCPSVSTSGSGTASVVSAVFMNAADTETSGSGLRFTDPFAIEHHLYNSTGTRVVVKVQANGEVSDLGGQTVAMKWFVRDRQWSLPNLGDYINDVVAEQLEALKH